MHDGEVLWKGRPTIITTFFKGIPFYVVGFFVLASPQPLVGLGIIGLGLIYTLLQSLDRVCTRCIVTRNFVYLTKGLVFRQTGSIRIRDITRIATHDGFFGSARVIFHTEGHWISFGRICRANRVVQLVNSLRG